MWVPLLIIAAVSVSVSGSGPAQAQTPQTHKAVVTEPVSRSLDRAIIVIAAPAPAEDPVSWLPRKAWTKAPVSRHEHLDPRRVVEIVVHHPDVKGQLADLSKAQVAKKLRAIRAFHMSSARGWSDIAYNYAVDGSGRIWDLTAGKVGAHAAAPSNPNENRRSVGVLLMLGDGEQPTIQMRSAFGALQDRLEKQYPKIKRVIGHKDAGGASTSCPGKAVESLIEHGRLGLNWQDLPPSPLLGADV